MARTNYSYEKRQKELAKKKKKEEKKQRKLEKQKAITEEKEGLPPLEDEQLWAFAGEETFYIAEGRLLLMQG